MAGILKRSSKVTFNKAGSGSVSGRVTLPVEMLELLGITQNDRFITLTYVDGKIIIEKEINND